ncbi:uroporphyrinogen-III synthase [uncultured Thiodictyon sp.]|uniref:uroporphyrinogen-III synthase n=1 Tax=uncultured Thiodictyon sp. TaxID=1846217 RepID=UPI0025F61B13|nr:uroporphyrinogen-III synthase [uncultured Thiodictyon sp.]
MSPSGQLAGLGVLVTRPQAQAAGLCRLIEAAGGRALPFPTMEIQPVADPASARALLAQDWDLMVFTSRNAVELALALGCDATWPRAARLAAIGRATAASLTTAGRAPDLVPPERFDSETLTAMPELAAMTGRRVLIVRGEGGRALLGEVLASRGATVEFAEVYRRVRPAVDPGPLLEQWPTQVGLAIATSDEVLLNLVEMLGAAGRDLLLATPLVVISERTATTAQGLGFRTVRVAERAEDQAIVTALGALAGEGGRRGL